MAEVILMPKMSDTMEAGVLVKWLKKEGDALKIGDILAEVETDKAVMELENYEAGTLLHVAVKEGDKIPVDGLIAVVGKKGENIQELLATKPTEPAKSDLSTTTEGDKVPVSEAVTPLVEASAPELDGNATKRIKSSPLAKKIAKEQDLDLEKIVGSGPGGRIIQRDVLQATKTAPNLAQSRGKEHYVDTPVSQMRQNIAQRLLSSVVQAPHFYVNIEVEVSQLIQARIDLNEHVKDTKISFNDLIIVAVARALKQHPSINSSWRGDHIRTYEHIHIGVAVAIPDGLLVPVLRFADTKSLETLSIEMKNLAAGAKARTLKPEQWEGSTFSISNLGMYKVNNFTAIINPPNACILAIGGIASKPVVRDGAVVPGNCLQLTLSSDHRVVDGATAASFLLTLKNFLETPVSMLL